MKIKISFFTNLKTLCFLLFFRLVYHNFLTLIGIIGVVHCIMGLQIRISSSSFDKTKGVKWVVELPDHPRLLP